MINVTIHEAKSNLSKLLHSVEIDHQIVRVFRNKTLVAQIVPIVDEVIDPLIQHSELQGIQFSYDPIEPLAEDEWPSEVI
jgi:antitoxin (DNA-binding transcriptional repressor) of toxin-antitoxin stability system